MVNFCCVTGCKNEIYPGCGFSFHRFPRDETLREKWLTVVPGKTSKTSLVCSKHFKVEDYVTTSRKFLKSNTIPSIFPKSKKPEQVMEPGFCSATCVDKESMRKEIKKPELKTSDIFATCPLPKRFEYPHWFNGYGCQNSKQHPFYRTTASEYGWYPPGIYSVSSIFFPAGQTFTNRLSAAGMYRNYSLNTGMDPVGY